MGIDNNEAISAGEKERAAIHLLDRIPQATFQTILARMKDDPASWWVPAHFGLGLTVRNHLRNAGFRWSDTALDDHWHEIVEMAAGMAADTRR